jgi:hypothetical protein
MTFDINNEMVVTKFAPGWTTLDECQVYIVIGEDGQNFKERTCVVDIDKERNRGAVVACRWRDLSRLCDQHKSRYGTIVIANIVSDYRQTKVFGGGTGCDRCIEFST